MPDLFADEFSGLRQQAEEKAGTRLWKKIEKESVEDVKRNRQNRKMIEDLPVLETDTIEPKGVDLSLYRRIGEEITKVVKHKPGMLYVKVIIRPKYALKDSTLLPPAGQKGVEIAPMPLMPVDKCIADTSLLAEILLQKYEYHVPFYRQIQQYRHLGMKGLTESTLDGWFKKTVELLKPLYEELKREVFSCDYVQVDETTVPVINREKHKADKEYLWMVRSVMERLVIFHYDGGSRPERSSNPWQINITSRDIFNVTVLQVMKQPSRPTPTCGCSTVWCIYVVILSRLWMKTGRWPNMH